MFKKKKQEDEWIILDDDFLDEEMIHEKTPPKPKIKKKQKTKKRITKQKKQKEIEQSDDDSFHECFNTNDLDYNTNNIQEHKNQVHKRKPNPLCQRDNDEYQYESYNDDIVEMEEAKPVKKWKIILPLTLIFILCLSWVGYMNTDFDDNGQAYVVPLEIHYERKYIKEADELLEIMVEINKTIDVDTMNLKTDYINTTAKLNSEMEILKEKTNKFSKYVGVPKKFEGYHAQIINFSISTQKLVDKLIKNYNDINYDSFRKAALEDYYNSFNNLKQTREVVDDIIFRNMGDD